MEFNTGALQYGDDARQPQVRQVRQPQALPASIEAMINNLSAQIRQLHSRMAMLESAIPALAANDKKTAAYVNGLGDLVSRVSTRTEQAVAALRTFARGGGVQSQQFVPRASDAVVAYDTPPRGTARARDVQPASGNGPSADLVDPGTDDAQMSPEDLAFYGEQEDG